MTSRRLAPHSLSRRGFLLAGAATVLLTACGDDASDTPADTGTHTDTDSDAGSDAGADASGTDAGIPDAAGTDSGTDSAIDTGTDTEVPLEGYAACYPEFPESVGVDIDTLGVTVGDHCLGTAHQGFDGIERVVVGRGGQLEGGRQARLCVGGFADCELISGR